MVVDPASAPPPSRLLALLWISFLSLSEAASASRARRSQSAANASSPDSYG
jgi:hypothetical protein